jgi:cellulose synthase/poly-beta-1,6-N-acetylglucosamine synthase-like glycosyltransferase
MRFAGMPWGGSLALRRDTLTQCDLLTKWSTCLCEDSCLGDELRTRNLRVEYVPNVSMVNDETTTLAACVRFISRQLVMTRLHADHWLTFVILGTIIPVMAIISFVFLGCTLMFEEWSRILLSMVIVEGYHIAVTIFERRMESLLDHVPVNSNAAQHNGWRPAKVLQVYVAQLLSIPVTLLAFIMAASARQVTWRGVTYEFNGRAQIQMQKYEPFQPMAEDTPVLQKVSI